MDRIEAMAKVRKLMAMTEARGCTEAEAKTAAGLAAKIMMEYAIESAALDLESAAPVERGPIEIWDDPLDATGGRTEAWKSRLALSIAHQMGCEIVKNGDALKIVGRPDAVQGVRYVYAYCAREVARLTVARAYGNGRVWVRSYRLGLIDAIREAMKAEQNAAKTEAMDKATQRAALGDSNALVLVSRAITLASSQYAETRGFLQGHGYRYRTSYTSARNDASARDRGRSDGAGIYRGSAGGSRQLGRETRRLT